MSSAEATKIARQYVKHINAGNAAAAFALAADDATFWVSGQGTMTKAGMAAMIAAADTKLLGPPKMTELGVTAEGERVATELQGRAKLKNGGTYENQYHFLFEVRNGKIVALKEYVDSVPARKAFFGD